MDIIEVARAVLEGKAIPLATGEILYKKIVVEGAEIDPHDYLNEGFEVRNNYGLQWPDFRDNKTIEKLGVTITFIKTSHNLYLVRIDKNNALKFLPVMNPQPDQSPAEWASNVTTVPFNKIPYTDMAFLFDSLLGVIKHGLRTREEVAFVGMTDKLQDLYVSSITSRRGKQLLDQQGWKASMRDKYIHISLDPSKDQP